MENYGEVKKFQTIVVSCIMFFVALVGVAIVSFVSLGKTRRENANYDALIASLKQEQQALQNNISNISSDEFLEEKARNELGMIKEGETLYIFE